MLCKWYKKNLSIDFMTIDLIKILRIHVESRSTGHFTLHTTTTMYIWYLKSKKMVGNYVLKSHHFQLNSPANVQMLFITLWWGGMNVIKVCNIL